MKKSIAFLALLAGFWSCNQPKQEVKEPEPVVEKPAPIAFGESKYSDLCKQSMAALSSGDVDGFLVNFADNAVYRFNNGDSIAGKTAISSYWKERRTKVIDKIEFTNDIWLPLVINEYQGVRTGTWVLAWFETSAKYKTGKSMHQWVHTLYHFNGTGQVEEVIQYLDRAPIMEAMKKN